MPREIPDFPNDWKKPTTDVGHGYDIELITPMVGGGAAPGEVDGNFPIRPTAIRGHLRHWWRLVRGYSLGAGMWQREEEVFGSTEFPSPVKVTVVAHAKADPFDPSDKRMVDPFGPVGYAFFAAIENKHSVVREGLRFRLTVQVADGDELRRRRTAQNERRRKAGRQALPASISPIDSDVDDALAAWLTFGGIGGRTRRGCGTINCRTGVGPVPPLPAQIFIGPAQTSALAAWRESLSVYQEFRQTPRGKKHTKTLRSGKTVTVPGRSHWPEADSIRKITGCSLRPPRGTPPSGVPADEDTRDHSTPVVPNHLLPAFPKAVLGLPINFHFADGPNKGRASADLDPKDVQLYPLLPTPEGGKVKAERMASPIITRPFRMEGRWFPAIIVLKLPLPNGMGVRVEGRNASLTGNLSHDLPLNRVIDSSLGAITPMRGMASAIDALISFLASRSFTEVTR